MSPSPRQENTTGLVAGASKEYITQDESQAPKYQSLMHFKKNNRCWWKNCSSLGPIARLKKPEKNPGAEEMSRRFRPAKVTKVSSAKENVVVARN